MHVYIYAYAGRARLRGSTTYTSHKRVSRTKTPSRHRRMNLQHAVQHSLNINFTRTNLRECSGLTPTLAYSTLCMPLYDQNQDPKEHVHFAFVDIGNALAIFASTQSACAQTCFRYMNNRIIISFLRVQIN